MKILKLGDICEISTGSTDTKDASENGQYPLFDRSKKVKASDKYLFDCEALIMPGEGAEFLPRHYIGKFDLHQRAYAMYNFSELINPQYLYYYLISVKNYFTDNAVGATVKSLRRRHFTDLEVPLPTLEKQKEIVEKLDSAFAEIDLLEEIHSKSNKDLLASLFDTYRDSLLTSACADSPEVEFGEIGNFVRGPFGGSLKKSIFKPSGIAVYEQQHAIYDNFEGFRYFIDDIKFQEMKRFEVKANDLIMSCSGTYGKIAVVPDGSPMGIINQALLKITPDKGVRSQFIKHWMQSSLFQLELEKDIGGAALQNVPSVAKMKSIKIRLPEEKIQIETIEKLDEVQVEIKLAKTVQESIGINYVALRQSLLSNAFSLEEAVV